MSVHVTSPNSTVPIPRVRHMKGTFLEGSFFGFLTGGGNGVSSMDSEPSSSLNRLLGSVVSSFFITPEMSIGR